MPWFCCCCCSSCARSGKNRAPCREGDASCGGQPSSASPRAPPLIPLCVWSTGSPAATPAAIAWVASPLSWSIIATVVIAILLLLGLWLVENLELALLFGSWIYLAALVLSPLYQPWFILLPLTLAICNASTRTTLLALLLAAGALLSYYFWLWPQPWVSQALINIGLPLLIWGWTLFFTSTWRMTHAQNSEQVPAVKPSPRFSRPPWLSRPSLPPARRR